MTEDNFSKIQRDYRQLRGRIDSPGMGRMLQMADEFFADHEHEDLAAFVKDPSLEKYLMDGRNLDDYAEYKQPEFVEWYTDRYGNVKGHTIRDAWNDDVLHALGSRVVDHPVKERMVRNQNLLHKIDQYKFYTEMVRDNYTPIRYYEDDVPSTQDRMVMDLEPVVRAMEEREAAIQARDAVINDMPVDAFVRNITAAYALGGGTHPDDVPIYLELPDVQRFNRHVTDLVLLTMQNDGTDKFQAAERVNSFFREHPDEVEQIFAGFDEINNRETDEEQVAKLGKRVRFDDHDEQINKYVAFNRPGEVVDLTDDVDVLAEEELQNYLPPLPDADDDMDLVDPADELAAIQAARDARQDAVEFMNRSYRAEQYLRGSVEDEYIPDVLLSDASPPSPPLKRFRVDPLPIQSNLDALRYDEDQQLLADFYETEGAPMEIVDLVSDDEDPPARRYYSNKSQKIVDAYEATAAVRLAKDLCLVSQAYGRRKWKKRRPRPRGRRTTRARDPIVQRTTVTSSGSVSTLTRPSSTRSEGSTMPMSDGHFRGQYPSGRARSGTARRRANEVINSWHKKWLK